MRGHTPRRQEVDAVDADGAEVRDRGVGRDGDVVGREGQAGKPLVVLFGGPRGVVRQDVAVDPAGPEEFEQPGRAVDDPFPEADGPVPVEEEDLPVRQGPVRVPSRSVVMSGAPPSGGGSSTGRPLSNTASRTTGRKSSRGGPPGERGKEAAVAPALIRLLTSGTMNTRIESD